MRAWVLTDGKAGDEVQCLGVAEALGAIDAPGEQSAAPRHAAGAVRVADALRADRPARGRPSRRGSPIAPPFPDLLIASGRRAVPYLRAVKRASRRRTFTVFLKDPRTGARAADLIWVPEHDRLRGPNVLATPDLAAPRLARRASPQPRAAPDPRLAGAAAAARRGAGRRRQPASPLHAGGRRRASSPACTRLAATGASLMVTASRRTPAGPARGALRDLVERRGGFLWDGRGDNPYLALLALADAIVVTADSDNMVGEAAATGAPILVFEPSGGHPEAHGASSTASRATELCSPSRDGLKACPTSP